MCSWPGSSGMYAEINYDGWSGSILLGQVCGTAQHGHSEGSGKYMQQCCWCSRWGSVTRLQWTAGVTSGTTSHILRLAAPAHSSRVWGRVKFVEYVSCCCCCCHGCETASIILLLLLLQSPCMQLATCDRSTVPICTHFFCYSIAACLSRGSGSCYSGGSPPAPPLTLTAMLRQVLAATVTSPLPDSGREARRVNQTRLNG